VSSALLGAAGARPPGAASHRPPVGAADGGDGPPPRPRGPPRAPRRGPGKGGPRPRRPGPRPRAPPAPAAPPGARARPHRRGRPAPPRPLEHLAPEPPPAPQGTHWLPPPVAHDVARRGEATVPSGPGRRAFLALGAGVAAMVAGAGGLLFHLRPDDDPPLRWT